MSVGVCITTLEDNNLLTSKVFEIRNNLAAMPVVSPHRYSASNSTSSSSTLTGSYRSTLLDRPYYSTATGSYITPRSTSYLRNTDTRDSTSKRLFSRHSSISEDSGISSRTTTYSRSDRSESREPSLLRKNDSSRDSGLSITGRRISTISIAESVEDLRQKYSPSNYIPNIRKPSENNLDISRSKSISNDIGRPPLENKIINESRSSLVRKNKVNTSRDSLTNNSLSVTTNTNTANNSKIDGASVEKIAKTSMTADNNCSKVTNSSSQSDSNPVNSNNEVNSPLSTQNADDDDNGNITQSVSEIRKLFDTPSTVKLTSVIPPFLKNTNSGKYEITQIVNNKTNELSVSCQNLKLSSNKSNNLLNNGNNVRWAFLSNSNKDNVCETISSSSSSADNDKTSGIILNKDNSSNIPSTCHNHTDQTSTSKKALCNHTSNFASYIPVNNYETKPVGDTVTNSSDQDGIVGNSQDIATNSESSPGDNDQTNTQIGDLDDIMSRDYSRRTANNRLVATDSTRYIRSSSPTRDLSTSPRLNRNISPSNTNGTTSGTIGTNTSIRGNSLEKYCESKTYNSTQQSVKNLGLNGLRNIGNTCFMNSVIQCLSNTRFLLEYLRDSSYLNDINNTTSSMKGALVKAFANVIQELWSGESDKIVNTTSLKSQIQRFAPRFMGYAQQDAQEFLRFFLEGLHEDVNRVTVRPAPILTEIDDNLSDSQKASEAWNRYLRMDNSAIVDIFVGQLKSTLKCSVCGYCSVTFDPFWDLSLPLGFSSITQCLENFTKEEVLDGHEKPTCSKCQQRRKCTKSFSIQKFPKILVLHLKRFSPTERFRGKLTTLVDFPLHNLDLSAFAANRGTSTAYNLYAISNHSGTTYSGHYTAYCKHPYSGDWHEYNDSRVSSISPRNIVSSEAYVLFYEQTGHSSHL